MSRGRGRGGRGGFGGASNLPPMGLTFADIQSMSREQGELYPVSIPLYQTELVSNALAAIGSITSAYCTV